jgi:HemY protein
MLRLLIFFAVIAAAAFGLAWLADNPGVATFTWRGVEYETSMMVALGFILTLAVVLAIVWSVLRFTLRLPSLISLAQRVRRREKGFTAISRGLIAIGAGDSRAAQRHAAEAHKLIGHEPLAQLLRAQAAQLAGDRAAAKSAFHDMLEHHETHALGLRGLHLEARRSGDDGAALDYAQRAHQHAALPWAAQAVLDDRARHSDWAGALATVESNAAGKLLDKATANRWRAVLKTAIALEMAERDPTGALTLAQEALALAPGLVPAAVVVGKLLAASGDYRKAARILETAYRETPHPDLAAGYLKVRRGDSALDKLERARALAKIAPFDAESQMTIARAALDAKKPSAAREALQPLVSFGPDTPRPTVRVCLLQAEVEEAEGHDGAVREWLARAARAPRDRAWVAEGVISDHWAPVSPSGALDAFVWRLPDELLSTPAEPPPPPRPAAVAPPPPVLEPPPPPPAPVPQAPAAAEILPAPPPPPREVASSPAPPTPRSAASRALLMPSAAPDDPGPPQPEPSQSAYRAFARE